MLYIADSTTLISLSSISQFHLLQEIFKEITITEAVYKEVVTDGNGKPGEDEVTNGIRSGWITIVKAKKPLPHFPKGLHDGERESLAYGMQLQKQKEHFYLILDDSKARKCAQENNMSYIGVLGTLVLAKKLDLLTEVRKYKIHLIEHGFRMNKNLNKKILEEAGEI